MQSRKDLRKRNHRNNLFLIIASLAIIVVIISGVVIHNKHVEGEARARRFATTHFNPNVTIYGVAVGNLTVNKATAKINRIANNKVELQNDKIKLSHSNKEPSITEKQVKNYFQQQHTSLPNKTSYTCSFKALNTAKNKLIQINKASVTYTVNKKSFVLKADDLIDKVSYENGTYKFDNVEKLTDKLKQINKEVSTLHKSYRLTVPESNKINGKTITVKNKSYGWAIYIPKAQTAVEKAFMNNQKKLDGSKYLYGLDYSTYAHGYGETNRGIGKNYVVVSIKNQELWIIRNNKLAVHLTDVVTGTYTGNTGDRTPTGVWYIQYKESPSVLRGSNDDGSSYASPVKYWMPFTLSGCGLHDASWRTDWSKTAYLKGGSHGCVNINPGEIANVWHNVIKDEAVVIYN